MKLRINVAKNINEYIRVNGQRTNEDLCRAKIYPGLDWFLYFSSFHSQIAKEKPDDRSSQIATTAIVLMMVSMVGIVALLVFGWSSLANRDGWAIFGMVLVTILFIFGLVVMWVQPRNHAVFPFTVPGIPFIPLASIMVNLFLLLKLSHWTWIRFGVWLTIGKQPMMMAMMMIAITNMMVVVVEVVFLISS